jgi:ATP-dependent RNA helicase DeaD
MGNIKQLRKISSIERIIKQKKFEEKNSSFRNRNETQLLHFSHKIKYGSWSRNTLSSRTNVFEDLSKELIKKMVSVEFNRFINYKKTRDISKSFSSERRTTEMEF